MKKIYLMVTSFKKHWDSISSGGTKYPKYMKSEDVQLKNETETIFIKVDGRDKVEKAWQGKVFDILDNENEIKFNVKIEKEIILDKKLSTFKQGWTYYNNELECQTEDQLVNEAHPPFFNEILKTTDWGVFENKTYLLLKLLGIHDVYSFKKQRGEADGFFKFENLAVLYDTTLENSFEEAKKTQISNFCNQMHTGIMNIAEANTIQNFHNHQKQVWIITRKESRLLPQNNDVIVKEVGIKDLITIYDKRLYSKVTKQELENLLRNI